MDDIKPTQSLDGMSGGRPSQPNTAPQSIDGMGGNNSGNGGGLNQFNDADYAPEGHSQDQPSFQEHHEEPEPNKSSGKGLKVLLTLFIILFIAAAAAAGYFYMKSQEEPAPAANTGNVQLEQQVESLTYDNKTLKTVNTTLTTQNKSLTTTAQQLKTKCGSGCSAIVIPQ